MELTDYVEGNSITSGPRTPNFWGFATLKFLDLPLAIWWTWAPPLRMVAFRGAARGPDHRSQHRSRCRVSGPTVMLELDRPDARLPGIM